MSVRVLAPGLLTTVQDPGRYGWRHLGVGCAGALDAHAHALANLLAGNPADAATLEITLAGPTLAFEHATRIALCGADLDARCDGIALPTARPCLLPAGITLALGACRRGARAYLAVAGGFDVPVVLGSRSTDLRGGFGGIEGRALRKGDVLPLATRAAGVDTPRAAPWWIDARPWFTQSPKQPLRLLPGKHLDALTESARESLFSGTFTVHADSNRAGLRLDGPQLECARPIEMISEGCLPGLLQLPPSGQPIAFGPECPVSGGYPRIGQIAAVDMPRLAQLRPGDAVRFTPCAFEDALHALRERERALDTLTANIAARLAP